MTALLHALKQRFDSPEDAIAALGLDETLLNQSVAIPAADSVENTTMNRRATRQATFVRGRVLTALQPTIKNMAMDLKRRAKDGTAKDIDLHDFFELLDALADEGQVATGEPEGDEEQTEKEEKKLEPMKESNKKIDAATDDEYAKSREFLKDKLSPEDMAKCEAIWKEGASADGESEEESEEEKKHREDEEKKIMDKKARDKGARDAEEDNESPITKSAMDAAISAVKRSASENALQLMRQVRDAERAVRPYVGELAMAHDSAEAVYRAALSALGVKEAATIHESALKTVLEMQPRAGAARPIQTIAQDAARQKSFADRFPNASRVG